MARQSKDPRIAPAVGRLIRLHRTLAEESQQGLADRTGGVVSPTTIAHYEAGDNCPSVERLFVLADALACDPGDLLPTRAMLEEMGGGQ